jgi:hypothetical protein
MLLEPQNRFTRRETTQDRGAMRLAFFIFLGIVSVIGWLYLFFISDLFQVKGIEVAGKGIDPVEVKREVYEVLDGRPRPFWQPARHSFFLQPEQIESLLTERLSAEHVTVDKRGFNILRLMIQARVRRFVLHTSTQDFWMDGRGFILSEPTLQEQKEIFDRLARKRPSAFTDPPIFSYPRLQVSSSTAGVIDPQIGRWLAAAFQLQKQGLSYLEIQPPQDASSTKLVVKTAQGYEAWFDGYTDTLEMQIEAFKAFQQQKPKNLQIKEYVDVRIPNKVYVK